MMKKNILIFTLLAGLYSTTPLAAEENGYNVSAVTAVESLASRVPATIRDRGTLIIGSDNAYAPWEYLDGDDGQTPEGIDVDLGKAIAQTLGLKFESITAPFASILPALGPKYDIGLSAFSITEERMKAVNFVSYAGSINLWAVKAGNPTKFDPANICGSKLALQSGSSHEKSIIAASEECVKAGNEAIEILPFANQPEAITRVVAGGADATLSGGATIGYAAVQSGGLIDTLRTKGKLDITSLNGIAVTKNDTELTELLADTLNHLIGTGVYGEIWGHWGVSELAVEKAVVNPEITWDH